MTKQEMTEMLYKIVRELYEEDLTMFCIPEADKAQKKGRFVIIERLIDTIAACMHYYKTTYHSDLTQLSYLERSIKQEILQLKMCGDETETREK